MNLAREEGQSLIVYTVLLFELEAFTALIIDGGFLLVNRRHAQNAAVAAALSAARELAHAKNDNDVFARVEEYALSYNA